MRAIFVDTSHLVAVLSPDDAWHTVALATADDLTARPDVQFVTTNAVLAELLTSVAKKHRAIKLETLAFVERMMASPRIEVIEPDSALFSSAMRLFGDRLDKQYSMVDCMSMVICEQRSITEVLTADRDFQQEGLRALLREQA